MEWEAKLDDQVSAPAESAAAGLQKTTAATRALDAQLRKLDVAQQRTARSKEAQVKAFNPEAYKRQIQAERDLGVAKEKALQGLKLGLSQKERDQVAAKTQAFEQQRAAVGRLTAAAKGAALSLFAVAGASGAMSLAQIAIGYRAVERLQMISFRAQVNLRRMFKGVDSKPLERSYMRLTDMLNTATPMGKALSEILTRGFNNTFKLIEHGTPYIEAFGQGLLLAALIGENAWLRLRIALVPVTSRLGAVTDRATLLKAVAYGTAASVLALGGYMAATAVIAGGHFALSLAIGAKNAVMLGLSAVRAIPGVISLGRAASTGAGPFLAVAAAITAVIVAADQFNKLRKEWDSDVLLRSIGIGKSDADRMNEKFDKEAAARKAAGKTSRVREVATFADIKTAPPSSIAAGEQIGAGLAAGMLSKVADVEKAGAGLAAAADRGVKTKAEIRSPARLFRRDAREMGAGTEKGLEDSAPKVQRAAERALVPEPPSAPAAAPQGASSGPASVSVHIDLSRATFGAGLTAGDVRAQIDEAVSLLVQMLMARLGVA